MGLDEYLSVIRARWLTVLLVLILAVGGTVAYSLNAPSVYLAKTRVFFSVKVADTPGARNRGFIYQQIEVRSYAQFATLPLVLTPVIKQLKLNTTPARLANSVTTRAPLNTAIVEILVTAGTPTKATSIADAIAKQLAATVTAVAPRVDSGTPTVSSQQIDPAVASSSPILPRTKLNIAVSIVFGLLAGAVAAIALDARARRRSGRRRKALLGDSPVIGTIAIGGDLAHVRDDTGEDTVRSKELRQLQLGIFDPASAFTSVAFTSGSDPRASSQLSAGLASVEAGGNQRVLLIDANLHAPSIAGALGLAKKTGLAEVLRGEVDLDDATQTWGEHGLQVLGAGTAGNPSELLNSGAMKKLLRQAAERYDVVLVNAPPFALADGVLLSGLADRAVMVVDRLDSRSRISEAVAALEAVRANVLGVVVTSS